MSMRPGGQVAAAARAPSQMRPVPVAAEALVRKARGRPGGPGLRRGRFAPGGSRSGNGSTRGSGRCEAGRRGFRVVGCVTLAQAMPRHEAPGVRADGVQVTAGLLSSPRGPPAGHGGKTVRLALAPVARGLTQAPAKDETFVDRAQRLPQGPGLRRGFVAPLTSPIRAAPETKDPSAVGAAAAGGALPATTYRCRRRPAQARARLCVGFEAPIRAGSGSRVRQLQGRGA